MEKHIGTMVESPLTQLCLENVGFLFYNFFREWISFIVSDLVFDLFEIEIPINTL